MGVRVMEKTRLEAFSDGVIAIIITIMVLELKPPHQSDLTALVPLIPVALSYVLSFVYVAIYWNNHHHMLHTVKEINGSIMWANIHLLFWLSIIPFTTAWMGENHFEVIPVALYGGVLFMCGLAYNILQRMIIRSQGSNSLLKVVIGRDWKGKLSPVLYGSAIASAFFSTIVAGILYVSVALMWLIPDRRIEDKVHHEVS